VRHKYIAADGKDQIMLEDESGRLQLAGSVMQRYDLCTGCIIAAIGTENKDGAFEIIDIKLADLPDQPKRWSLSSKPEKRDVKSQIAIVSGLELDGVYSDTLTIDLLQEYLVGEAGDSQSARHISRLLLVGNSLTEASPIPAREETNKKSTKKYGLDPSAYNSSPVHQLDAFLSTLLPSLPVTLIPGATDPATVAFPQQPLHAAFFPASRAYIKPPKEAHQGWDGASWFDNTTNPWEGEVDGWRVLATGGQPVNDMFKYVDNDDRLKMMECFLRWRNVAPTAPDTLCMLNAEDGAVANPRQGRIRSRTRTRSCCRRARTSSLWETNRSSRRR
jgi:DNA polymerase delta subunit 2